MHSSRVCSGNVVNDDNSPQFLKDTGSSAAPLFSYAEPRKTTEQVVKPPDLGEPSGQYKRLTQHLVGLICTAYTVSGFGFTGRVQVHQPGLTT